MTGEVRPFTDSTIATVLLELADTLFASDIATIKPPMTAIMFFRKTILDVLRKKVFTEKPSGVEGLRAASELKIGTDAHLEKSFSTVFVCFGFFVRLMKKYC